MIDAGNTLLVISAILYKITPKLRNKENALTYYQRAFKKKILSLDVVLLKVEMQILSYFVTTMLIYVLVLVQVSLKNCFYQKKLCFI